MNVGNPENKEVMFSGYCEICKYSELEETLDPCNECLETPMRVGTTKPERFEEKTKK